MANYYQNNVNFTIDLENIGNYLNCIVRLISEPPKKAIDKIINKTKVSEENSYNDLELEINNKIFNMYQNMDEIAFLLKDNDFFYEEYFDFREIQDMIKDTLERDFSEVTNDDLGFIISLIRNFSDLIGCKILNADNNQFNEENYELKHQSYFSNLNELKTYFYENISDEIINEESFLEYSGIIMR